MVKTQFVKTESLNELFSKWAWGEAAVTFKELRGKNLDTSLHGSRRGGSRLRARVLTEQY